MLSGQGAICTRQDEAGCFDISMYHRIRRMARTSTFRGWLKNSNRCIGKLLTGRLVPDGQADF